MKKLLRKDKTISYSYMKRVTYQDFIASSEIDIVQSLINSASNLFYDIETSAPALNIKLKNDNFIILTHLPDNVFNLIKDLIIQKDYNIRKKEVLVQVTSRSNHNSSFIFLENKNIILTKIFGNISNIKCLISDRINLPIFFGHNSSIQRLIEESDFSYKILSITEGGEIYE